MYKMLSSGRRWERAKR